MKKIHRFVAYGCCLLFLVVLTGRTTAQSLSDFQSAVNNEGCASIPYSSVKSRCQDAQSKINDYCKVEQFNCDQYDPGGAQQQINNMTGKISDLKRDKEGNENKLSSASDQDKSSLQGNIRNLADQIQSLQNKIDELKSRLNNEKSKIRDCIDRGNSCLTWRSNMRGIFNEAIGLANNEKDPAIKAYAEKLIDKWREGNRKHEDAVNNVLRALEKCKGYL